MALIISRMTHHSVGGSGCFIYKTFFFFGVGTTGFGKSVAFFGKT